MPVFVWQILENDFEFLDYNRAAAVLTQGRVKNLMGLRATALYGDQPEMLAMLRRARDEGRAVVPSFRFRLVTTGEERIFHKTAFKAGETIVIAVRERSESRATVEYDDHRGFRDTSLHLSKSMLEAMVSSSLVGYLRTNAAGFIEEASARWLELHDVITDPTALPWWTWVASDQHDEIARLVTEALARGAPKKMEYPTSALRPRWILAEMVPLEDTEDDDGGCWLVVGHDVTELREAQAQAAAAEARALRAEKMESIGRLAGGIAHDFNNVLAAISGAAEVLRERLCSTGEPAPELDDIVAASRSGARLTRQLLDQARSPSHEPSALDLTELLTEFEAMLRRVLGEDIDVRVDVEDEPLPILIERSRIEQVLWNLAVNARDAMPRGGQLSIRARLCRTADLEELGEGLDISERWVALQVTDDGVGMNPSVQRQIFEPFFSTKPEDKGVGLGLATALAIVHQAGGRIDVESQPGTGTTFRLWIPATQALPIAATPAPAATRPTKTARVMVVEDNELVRSVLTRLLRNAGYELLEAEDGQVAFDLAQSGADFDLLVSDVVMPRLSGPELAMRLRASRPELPVLFLSGYHEDEVLRRGNIAPPCRLLTKPASRNDLMSAIVELLEARERD